MLMKSQKNYLQSLYKESLNLSFDSLIVAFFVCVLIAVYLLQTNENFFHWFLIPVTLNGMIIGVDAIDWCRGRMHILDPVGILGLLGFHFFFLAPILHVSWDSWLEPWFPYPPDWRPWLGGMAIFNLLGILIYRFCRKVGSRNIKTQSGKRVWQLNYKRLALTLPFLLMISAVLQIMAYRQFGGIASYINAATELELREANPFQDTAILFMFSESFPILAMFGFAVYAQRNKKMQNSFILVLVLIVLFILAIFFGGLRGNRSNIIWTMFWGLGIIHFKIKPITKKQIALGLVFFLLFMYLYGFFKAGGLEVVQKAIESQQTRTSIEKDSGRSWEGMLLGDLGRSDIHALMLYKIMQHDSEYKYAWGRTYAAAFTILIPRSLLPNRPPGVVMEGTELTWGKGSYIPGKESSKVYGLAGEAMLNFGPFAIPFAFILLGLVVRQVRYWLYTLEPSDSRVLCFPLLVNLCFTLLVNDFYINLFFIIKNGLIPFFIILINSTKESSEVNEIQI
jgi:hypothetical protein